jgi:N-acetylglucosamine kinase-like BadF-type ATPase
LPAYSTPKYAAANSGDAVARQILEKAAAEMAETLRDAVDSLGIASEDYVMVGTGSVATNSEIYWRHLCRLAKGFAPNFKPELTTQPAVVGIALAALCQIGAGDAQTLRRNLFSSATEICQRQEPQIS